MGLTAAFAARRALRRAHRSGDRAALRAAHADVTAAAPDDAAAWFDRGLHAKHERDWALSARCNARALELEGDGRENPSAWNLGIAATALGDWATARRAWTAYGVSLPPGDGPVDEDLGRTPVRLNPELRYPGQAPLLLDGVEHATEVVWVERRSPAHGRVLNVPTPDSGHRFGDVVLHDGVPVGERRSGDRHVPVFDELAVLERSAIPTLQVDVRVRDAQDLDELVDAFLELDLAATEWASTVRMLCRACSEGAPVDDAAHDHAPVGTVDDARQVAIAAPPDVAERVLRAWADAPGRSAGTPSQIG